jgi:hypothetical protein
LSTAETVAFDTPVSRATSEMVGRFPVIAQERGFVEKPRSVDVERANRPELA